MSNRMAGGFVVGLMVFWCAGCTTTDGGGDVVDDGGDVVDDGGDVTTNGNDGSDGGDVVKEAPELFGLSSSCAVCHNLLEDEAGEDVSIESAWKATMMANAARDPYFLGKVATESARLPSLKETIEDTCSTCHMPMAHTQEVASGRMGAIFEDGFADGDNVLHAEAFDGVSCTLCHQIEDEGLGESGSFVGKFVIDTTTEKPGRVNYGPFANPVPQQMTSVSGFVPVEGQHVTESALCATCHTLYTPYVDGDGNLADGLFPEQVAFLEWGHSEYSDGVGEDRTCQDCHMPAAEGGVTISTIPMMLSARSPFGQHHFVGGNTLMLGILSDNAAELEVAAGADDFDGVVARVENQLSDNAGALAILEAAIEGDELLTEVAVANLAGHKFPTGFPARRLWIHFLVTDVDGSVLFESGAAQADGRIGGNDADADSTTYEPHYTTITDEDQVQVYESIMQNTDDEVTYTLLRAASYAKDNRLLPAGFEKATAESDFAVVGAALDDEDFVGGGDVVAYQVDVAGAALPLSVSVELLYQSVAVPFVEDMRTEADVAQAAEFVGYFDEADKSPTVVAAIEVSVE